MTRVKSCIAAVFRSSDSFEPGARPRGDRSVELTFVEAPFWFLEHEVGTAGRKFPRGLRWIVGVPFRLATRRIADQAHNTVGCDDVGVGAYQRGIGFEFLENVGFGVTRIENDHDPVVWAHKLARAR